MWMGNARGCRYSRRHVKYNPEGGRSDRKNFWSFSWHEIGTIDLPAMIDYVLDATKFAKIQYIGHSQGTTTFFVMCSERPEYNDKIILMNALAPVAYVSNIKSPVIRVFTPFLNSIEVLTWVATKQCCVGTRATCTVYHAWLVPVLRGTCILWFAYYYQHCFGCKAPIASNT